MQRGKKRDREEGFNLDGFCQQFLQSLRTLECHESALYRYLKSVDLTDQTPVSLINACKTQKEIQSAELVVLIIALLFEGKLTDQDIQLLQQAAASADELGKAAEDMIEAIKLDIVTAIRPQSTPLIFMQEMIKCLLRKPLLEGIQALLNKIDCGYGEYLADETKFGKADYAVIHYKLIKIISEQYTDADKLSLQEEQQKAAEILKGKKDADKVLKKLGCNKHSRSRLLKKFQNNPFQLHMLASDYNTVMVKAVKDQPAKITLIEQLMEVGNEAKSKRQRFNLCPDKYSQSVLAWLKDSMSELEYLFFTLEGVQDESLVLETIHTNRELFDRGVDVADCCKVIPENLRLEVLNNLIDENCDAKYIVETLGGVSPQLAAQYLLECSAAINHQDEHAYLQLIRMSSEGTELEKVLFQLLDCFTLEDIKFIMEKLEDEFGVDYLIACLSLMSNEHVLMYVSHRQTCFVGASENALRDLFTIILVSSGVNEPINERLISTIAAVVASADTNSEEDQLLQDFNDAINLYLSYLPDYYKIIVMYGVYQAFTAVNHHSFVHYLNPLNQHLFLRAKATVIASDFPLEEILTLCRQRMKADKVLGCYSGWLEVSDIELFERLVRERKVKRSDVRSCVLRSFKKYIEEVPKFIICESTNVFLTLLARYALTEFRKYIRPEFMNMVLRSGSFMSSVARFPEEIRLEILLSASSVCYVRELNQLNNVELFPARYNHKRRAYLKRAIASNAKSYSAFAYMKAVFEVDAEAYLEYCAEIKDLRGVALASYINVTDSNAMRVNIVCALARHINLAMYRKIANTVLVLGESELKLLRDSDLQSGVAKIVNSQVRDYRLTKRLSTLNRLTAEDLARSDQESLHVKPSNPEYSNFFSRMIYDDSIIKSMTELLETERFDYIMEIANRYDTLLIRDPGSRVTKVQAMISLLPVPFQRVFAEKVVLLFNSNEQIARVASSIADENERQAFIDNNKIKPKASVVKFGAFNPKRDAASSAEPPNKQRRVHGKKH